MMVMNSKQAKRYRECEALDKEFKLLEDHLKATKLPLTARHIEDVHDKTIKKLTKRADTKFNEEEE